MVIQMYLLLNLLVVVALDLRLLVIYCNIGKRKPLSKSASATSTISQKHRETLAALEQERDFYFSKLREIELLCQATEKTELVEKVLTILYKTQEGFEIPAVQSDSETF